LVQLRRILLTGGTSGIGFEAARLLSREGHQLILPCRHGASGAAVCQRLGASPDTPVCDLADFHSVKQCCAALLQADEPIDTLVLNAGLQYSGAAEPLWSAQGFELTVAVNHLAHQALLQWLLPLLQRGRDPRVVITASEVHDPRTPGGRVGRPAGLGTLAGLRRGAYAAMVDGSENFNADKAYKDSKLCNLLMAHHLVHRLKVQGPAIPVLAWSPGLVIPRGQAGFFRYSRRHNPAAQTLFAFLARDLLRVTETPQGAGALLAGLARDPLPAPISFQYWSNRVIGPGRLRFEPTAPSAEACSDVVAGQLWDLSEALIAGC
jgi:protochlorophyllide reductase